MRVTTILLLILSVLVATTEAQGMVMNIEQIIKLESSGNPTAYNKGESAIGLMQIRPCVLTEWNRTHPHKKYSINDLFYTHINIEVGSWYLEHRIPEMLNRYGKPLSVENIIISWNAGIKYVRDNIEPPKKTKRYIKKYLEG
jgi:soluble lytic murein transglycosylase-like protein